MPITNQAHYSKPEEMTPERLKEIFDNEPGFFRSHCEHCGCDLNTHAPRISITIDARGEGWFEKNPDNGAYSGLALEDCADIDDVVEGRKFYLSDTSDQDTTIDEIRCSQCDGVINYGEWEWG